MNRLLWILQIFFGIYFVAVGINHFVLPDGLPSVMSWMYELTETQHTLAGAAEILGGLGLIVPAVTRVQPQLVALAAVGLVLVMIGAVIWHAGRGETAQITLNVILAAILAFLAYGRWRLSPLERKSVR